MIDPGMAAGLIDRYQEKLEQERGIPIWVRVGHEGGLILVGHIDPRDADLTPKRALSQFFSDLVDALRRSSD